MFIMFIIYYIIIIIIKEYFNYITIKEYFNYNDIIINIINYIILNMVININNFILIMDLAYVMVLVYVVEVVDDVNVMEVVNMVIIMVMEGVEMVENFINIFINLTIIIIKDHHNLVMVMDIKEFNIIIHKVIIINKINLDKDFNNVMLE